MTILLAVESRGAGSGAKYVNELMAAKSHNIAHAKFFCLFLIEIEGTNVDRNFI
jgi:hypothetical protein